MKPAGLPKIMVPIKQYLIAVGKNLAAELRLFDLWGQFMETTMSTKSVAKSAKQVPMSEVEA